MNGPSIEIAARATPPNTNLAQVLAAVDAANALDTARTLLAKAASNG